MIESNVSEIKIQAMRDYLTQRVIYERAYTIVKKEYIDKNLSKVRLEEVIFNCQKDGFYLVDINQWRLEKKKKSS